MNQQLEANLQQDMKLDLQSEADTQWLGELIAQKIQAPTIIYLQGELGVGKTRLVRAIIQSLGHRGNVKSPTYTLVEPYRLQDYNIHHFDLYRISDPEELEYLGIRDYFDQSSISFIEWPDNGKGWLAPADILISLEFLGEGRNCTVQAKTEVGNMLLSKLKQNL